MGRWDDGAVVGSFAGGAPNGALVAWAAEERRRGGTRAADLGCGAARNVMPLLAQGWSVVGTDLSLAMLTAARERVGQAPAAFVRAPMDALPLVSASCDAVIAHGLWNLARSGAEMRRAIAEAARVARAGAGLFVFTFSRRTLPADADPEAGETFVFRQFSGEPQCFLTADELRRELSSAGFLPDGPLDELNAPPPGVRSLSSGGPVIWQGTFRRA